MRPATCHLSDDVLTATATWRPAVLSDVSLPDEHGHHSNFFLHMWKWRWWRSWSFFALELWSNKAGDVSAFSGYWFLRTSFDSVECRSTPSLAGCFAHDPSREVHSCLGGHNVGAGPQVGAEPDAVDYALGHGVLVPLLLGCLERPEQYTLAKLS